LLLRLQSHEDRGFKRPRTSSWPTRSASRRFVGGSVWWAVLRLRALLTSDSRLRFDSTGATGFRIGDDSATDRIEW